MRVVTTLVVHRAGVYAWYLPLCETPTVYQVTNRACTYITYENGKFDIAFVDAPVDCMSCLVEEARRTSGGVPLARKPHV